MSIAVKQSDLNRFESLIILQYLFTLVLVLKGVQSSVIFAVRSFHSNLIIMHPRAKKSVVWNYKKSG